MGKILHDAESAAADVGIAMIHADRTVANEDLAGTDGRYFRLLEAEAIEAAVVPEHDCPHHHDTSCSATLLDPDSVTSLHAGAKYVHMLERSCSDRYASKLVDRQS